MAFKNYFLPQKQKDGVKACSFNQSHKQNIGVCILSTESLPSLERLGLVKHRQSSLWTTIEKVGSKNGKNLVNIDIDTPVPNPADQPNVKRSPAKLVTTEGTSLQSMINCQKESANSVLHLL